MTGVRRRVRAGRCGVCGLKCGVCGLKCGVCGLMRGLRVETRSYDDGSPDGGGVDIRRCKLAGGPAIMGR